MADLTRSKTELILENAFLRQQLIILDRQEKRPLARPSERVLLVALASQLRAWRQALLIVQPATLVRWHQDLYRWLWKRKSEAPKRGGRPPLRKGLVDLIQRMAGENRTWGAERIRGELLKLEIRVSKRTIQKYINPYDHRGGQARPGLPSCATTTPSSGRAISSSSTMCCSVRSSPSSS